MMILLYLMQFKIISRTCLFNYLNLKIKDNFLLSLIVLKNCKSVLTTAHLDICNILSVNLFLLFYTSKHKKLLLNLVFQIQ